MNTSRAEFALNFNPHSKILWKVIKYISNNCPNGYNYYGKSFKEEIECI